MRGSKSKSDLPSKEDGFIKGDSLSKATKAWWREWNRWSDEFSLMINKNKIGGNKGGSEVYIGQKRTEDEVTPSSRSKANRLEPLVLTIMAARGVRQ